LGDTYYVTTPIYYVNADPHIGTAYTTVAADCVARYHRLLGKRVFFLTGTDEHGQKVARAAEAKGVEPKEWVDNIVPRFTGTWELLNISNDDFLRTTERRHMDVAQRFIGELKDRGDVYLSTYEGWYCVHDETFLLPSQLVEDNCPHCGRPVDWVKEENYFFRLSEYADRVLQHIEQNPEFVQPEVRRNEVISFITGGLEDQSISRTSFTWGIPLPFDTKHIAYVWLEALINYISAIGYGSEPDRFDRTWPADLHLIGKEILRFHAVLWPAMLMAAGLPLPKRVFAHGWLTVEGKKMSKSLGNVIRAEEIVDSYGVDAYRYYFLREFSFGLDGNFSWRTLLGRYNGELANDLGNLVSRVLTMVHKYRDGTVGQAGHPGEPREEEEGLRLAASEVWPSVKSNMEKLSFNEALSSIWEFVHAVNRYVDVCAPWSVAKDEGRAADLDRILYNSMEGLRIIALYVYPFIPETAEKMWSRLGINTPLTESQMPGAADWGGLPVGLQTTRGDSLFPRKTEEVPEDS
jgi:methionyl-tRNA synthetase